MLDKSECSCLNCENCKNIKQHKEELHKYYFIGIGGISMSALAKILKSRGYIVCGSDATPSKLIRQLREEGINVKIGSSSKFVRECDVVVVTGAIREDNKDLVLAKKLGKKIITRAELLGEITKDYKLISVAGTHGKTTTTGMISSILLEAGIDPNIHIGGILNNIHSNLHIGKSEYFVTEACEYKDSFLSLRSFISIILNVPEDHLHYFQNIDNIYRSFSKFASNTDKNGVILYNYDQFDERLKLQDNKISFGLTEGADVRACNIKEYTDGKYQFDLLYHDIYVATICLPCFGQHNVYNALAACAAALFLGVDKNGIVNGIKNFKGVERRNEIIKESNGHIIIHDYAHHPEEIKATIEAYREIKKEGKIIAIFQPHTYTRTKDLFEEFVGAFDNCDEVWLVPIYAAREKPIDGISSYSLASKIKQKGKKCRYFDDFSSCQRTIKNEFDSYDIFAILGAGDIEKLAYSFKET